jgi:cellulose biosynthesis protein BcsQ
MFAARSYSVKFFDADRQHSGQKWCQLRASFGVRPVIVQAEQGASMYDDLIAADKTADITIVDVTGARGTATTVALGLADVALLPVIPGQLEVWALDDAAEVIDGVRAAGAGFKAYGFMNNAPSHPNSRDVRSTRAALNAYRAYFHPLETVIIGRQVFKDALCCGMGVVEMDGGHRDQKATANLNEFFGEVFHEHAR